MGNQQFIRYISWIHFWRILQYISVLCYYFILLSTRHLLVLRERREAAGGVRGLLSRDAQQPINDPDRRAHLVPPRRQLPAGQQLPRARPSSGRHRLPGQVLSGEYYDQGDNVQWEPRLTAPFLRQTHPNRSVVQQVPSHFHFKVIIVKWSSRDTNLYFLSKYNEKLSLKCDIYYPMLKLLNQRKYMVYFSIN